MYSRIPIEIFISAPLISFQGLPLLLGVAFETARALEAKALIFVYWAKSV
jgi:hypothetical protein